MQLEKINELKKALKFNGFKYIKIELEANVNFNIDSDNYYDDCNYETDNLDIDYFNEFKDEFFNRISKYKNKNEDIFKYLELYNDGSVNTEMTFTISINYLHLLDKFITEFCAVCRYYGDMETKNAGLHITLLEGYKYPRRKKLNLAKVLNFEKNINNLMNGLLFLSSPRYNTRSTYFRNLAVSPCDKYTAIFTHNDTCLEYRVFDTCYDNVNYIYNYLELIVKTLQFYTEKTNKNIVRQKNNTPIYNNAYRINHSNEIIINNKKDLMESEERNKYYNLNTIFFRTEAKQKLLNDLYFLVSDKKRNLINKYFNKINLLNNEIIFNKFIETIKCVE